MRVAQQFMLMVVVAVVVAAVVLSPGRDERAAVLASEGRHKEAIALLERQLSSAPNDPDLLAALGRSYAALGEVRRAIEAFDAYLAMRPDDLVARESVAELLLRSGMIDRYLEALARVVAAQPSPGRVTQLIELFRLHGRAEDELAALQAYASKAMLGAPQLERLGAILADRGNWREARNWLELANQKAPPDASAGRLLLLEVLIQNNEVDRVDERAQVWMKAWRSPFLCGRLILRLAQSGFSASASGLAVKYADLMPDETFEMVGLLVAQGRQDIAHQMLVRWADRETKSTGPQLRAFVHASALVGDVRGPLVKLAQLVRSDPDSEALGELIEELANTFGKPALAAIRPLLSDEVLRKQPLFAAELSLFEGNREMARWFLSGIEPAELSPERSINWLALLHRVETDADVVKRLTVLWNDGRLPPELVPDFANEAVKLGQMRTHDLLWSSARQ